MKWSMDTHKYISETTRKALQIMVSHNISSESEPEAIDAAERDMAENGVYKDYEGAKGRVRRALFTYFKAYGCLDSQEHLTEVGKAFVDEAISVQELSFWYIVNYKYKYDEIEYFPTQLILKCLKMLFDKDESQAFISAYDFSKLVECNSIEDITALFVDELILQRKSAPIEVQERTIGYDVWAKMLVQAGIFNRTADRNLTAKSWSLIQWILESYETATEVTTGELCTGIIKCIPVVNLRNPHGSANPFSNECDALQAFLFDSVDDYIVSKYIFKTQDLTLADMKSTLGLCDEDNKGFYVSFSGLEHLVGYVLSGNNSSALKTIGHILLSLEVDTESETELQEVKYETGYASRFSRNRILFGAPGTGKSYTLNQEKDDLLSDGGEYERVTFHPDYSYANFVGTYKPVPCKDSDDKDAITYEYVPGPFMRIYVKALENSRTTDIKPFLLIVEEINRANVAAVFGDVFQLLDRDDNEVSEYPIQASEDIKKYLNDKLGKAHDKYNTVKMPDNMFIWATMNSADQGVFPMDTAFKRRWDFTYLGINNSEDCINDKFVTLGTGKNKRTVEWNELRKAINEELSTIYKVNEDKLLGPHFLSKKVVPKSGEIDAVKFVAAFKSKVIMYLFEDAAKQKRDKLFNGCLDTTKYSAICKDFDSKGVLIFCENIRNKFPALTEAEVE
jgi:hypothetical protein